MGIFVVSGEQGNFLARGQRVKVLPEQTDFYLFASSKEDASKFAVQYVGDRIGHSSKVQSQAIFDPTHEWMKRANESKFLSAIEEVVTETSHLIGSISIEGYVIISPEHSEDTLIISLAEGDRKRTLIEKIYNKEDGLIEWGEDMHPFNVLGLAKAIQKFY